MSYFHPPAFSYHRDTGVSFHRDRRVFLLRHSREVNRSGSGKSVKPYRLSGDLWETRCQLVTESPAGYGRRYMDIRYDCNFKRVFGREEGKKLLTDLLNSLFEGRKTFNNVRLGPTERQGVEERSREVRFDVQCIGGAGEQILIEMQRQRQENFFGRQEFYALRLGSEQVPGGRKGDDFPMPEIYAIAILDFDIWRGMELPVEMQNEYVNSFDLRHIRTGYPYPRKLELMLVELRKFNKEIDELETRTDKWMYLFKNLHRLTKPVFTDDPMFRKLFQLTEYNKLISEDRKMLIDYEREERNKAKSWKQEGMEEGLARGRKEGRMEGRRKGRMEGRRKGRKEGRKKGRKEGIKQGKLVLIQALIKNTDLNDRKIAFLAGVGEDFVRNLRSDV